MPDSIEEIAQRLERAADRYHNAADFLAERDALYAAARVRRATGVPEAQQVEQMFMNSHLSQTATGAPSYPDLSQNAGCLSGWLSGGRRGGGVAGPGPWQSTTAGGGPRFGVGMGSYYPRWSVYPYFTSDDYATYTLAGALGRHLPPGYGDPTAYARQVAGQTGIDPNARLGDLTPAQMATLTDAIDANPNWGERDPLPDIAGGASARSHDDRGYRGADYSTGSDFGGGSGSGGGGGDATIGSDFGGSSAAPSDNS